MDQKTPTPVFCVANRHSGEKPLQRTCRNITGPAKWSVRTQISHIPRRGRGWPTFVGRNWIQRTKTHIRQTYRIRNQTRRIRSGTKWSRWSATRAKVDCRWRLPVASTSGDQCRSEKFGAWGETSQASEVKCEGEEEKQEGSRVGPCISHVCAASRCCFVLRMAERRDCRRGLLDVLGRFFIFHTPSNDTKKHCRE